MVRSQRVRGQPTSVSEHVWSRRGQVSHEPARANLMSRTRPRWRLFLYSKRCAAHVTLPDGLALASKDNWRGICGFLLSSTPLVRFGPDARRRVSRRPHGSRRFFVRSVSGFVDFAVTRLWCISNRTGCRCNVRGVDSSPADGTSERGRPFAVIKSCLRQSRQRPLSHFAAGWRRNGQPGRERFRWS